MRAARVRYHVQVSASLPPSTIEIASIGPCGPVGNNVFLVYGVQTRRAICVDAPFDATETVLAALASRSLTLEWIVATHHHWDHVAGLARLAGATGAAVAAHALDTPKITGDQSSGFLPGVLVEGCPVTRELAEGDTLEVDGVNEAIRVLHTPGHTPGSICLHIPGAATLLSGDTLFAGGYGRVDLPGGHLQTLGVSLRRLSSLPGETRVLPGHGGFTTIAAEPWGHRPPFTRRP